MTLTFANAVFCTSGAHLTQRGTHASLRAIMKFIINNLLRSLRVFDANIYHRMIIAIAKTIN